MDFQELEALVPIAANPLVVSVSTFGENTPISDLLAFLPDSTLSVSVDAGGGVADASAQTITFPGTAAVFQSTTTAFPVTAVFFLQETDGDGVPQLHLTVTGWTLVDVFPALAGTDIDAIVVGPSILFASDAVAPLTFRSALTADPTVGSPLAPAAFLLTNLSSLTLTGPVVLPADAALAPDLVLSTEAAATIGFGALMVAPVVTAAAWYDDTIDPLGPQLETAVNVSFELPLSAGVTETVTVQVVGTTTPLLVFTASGLTVPLGSFSELSALQPNADFAGALGGVLPASDSLSITNLSAVFAPESAALLSATVTVATGVELVVIPGAITFDSVSVTFTVSFQPAPAVRCGISSLWTIGDDESGEAIVDVSVTVPGLRVSAFMISGAVLLSYLIEQLVKPFGSAPALPTTDIVGLELVADPGANSYIARADFDTSWEIDLPVGKLALESVSLLLNYSATSMDVGIEATFQLEFISPLGAQTFDLQVLAEASDDGGAGSWMFSLGSLPSQVVPIGAIVDQFLGKLDPSWGEIVPADLGITNLAFSMSSSTTTDGSKSDSYSFQGQTASPWTLQIGGETFALSAALAIQSNAGAVSGTISGTLDVNGLALGLTYAFQPNSSKSIQAAVVYDGVTLDGTLTWGTGQDTVATFQLLGVTFGEIVDWLVDFVEGTSDYELPPPWNVLDQLNLSALTLTVDLTASSIGATIAVNQNLGFADIETFTLTYRNVGGSGTLLAAMTGSFAGQSFPAASPLQWDMLHDPSPAPPGTTGGIFQLDYLGVGENVVFVDPGATTVGEVIQALEQTITSSGKDGPPWQGLQLAGDNNLFFGTSFTLMNTFSLGAVFDDPNLYGLAIALRGPRAGALSGLEFEILYRRLSPSLGVYTIDLQVPAAMRHIELGEVTLTLPNIVVEVYTNGDFYVDFGYPSNGDYSQSFGIAVFPFIGAGGFYFGVVPPQAATNLPAVSNGSMNPVVEFGVAMEIGTGAEFAAGPLSGGVTLAVEGSLAGVLSWFNPNDPNVAPAQYYFIQGSIGIVAQLWAQADFIVIKVNVTASASAVATLTIESYEPILIELAVSVSVTASIKIIFFTVSFSFSTNIDTSFTIGSASTPPWQLASAQAVPQVTRSGRLIRRRARHALQRRRRIAKLRRLRKARRSPFAAPSTPADVVLAWTVPNTFAANAPSIEGLVVPAFTVANGALEVVLLVMLPDLGATGKYSGFNAVVDLMVTWAIQALLGAAATPETNPSISLPDLQNIFDALSIEGVQANFTGGTLDTALAASFQLQLAEGNEDVHGAVFPMPTQLSMALDDGTSIEFASYNEVPSSYLDQLDVYFAQLNGNYAYAGPDDPLQSPPGQTTQPAELAMPQIVLADYLLLVARAAVQSAIDVLARSQYTIGSNDSLIGITNALMGVSPNAATTVPYRAQPNDTLAAIAAAFEVDGAAIQAANPDVDFSQPITAPVTLTIPQPPVVTTYYFLPTDSSLFGIAQEFGVAVETLEQLNPNSANATVGTPLLVPVDTFLFALAAACANLTLAKQPILSGISYAVRGGDTLAGIATMFTTDIVTLMAEPNSGATILQAGATITLEDADGFVPYQVVDGDTANLVAAWLYARNLEPGANPDLFPSLYWFVQTIGASNAAVDFTQPLTTGTPLQVPTSLGSSLNAYTTKAGDTLQLVAAYFAIQASPNAGYQDALNAVNAAWPNQQNGQLLLAPIAHVIQQQDTVDALAAAFGLQTNDVIAANQDAPILAPGSVLALPPFPASGSTLAEIAQAHGLTQETLAALVAPVQGLFTTAQSITLPAQLSMNVQSLADAVVQKEEGGHDIAGIASRFMLAGAQLPNPYDTEFTNLTLQEIAEGQANSLPDLLQPLYTLTGQQFPAPLSGSTLATLSLDDGVLPGSQWVTLPGGKPLVVTLPTATLPDTTLSLTPIVAGPTALTFGQEVPRQYPLTTSISWTAAAPPPFAPGEGTTGTPPVVAQPTIWTFDTSLLDAIEGNAAEAYALVTGSPLQSSSAPQQAAWWDWGTILPIQVSQIPSASGGAMMPNTYALSGVTQDASALLAGLAEYFDTTGADDDALVYLLYQAAPGASLPNALSSDALDPANTFLLQTNLSTEAHPQLVPAAKRLGAPDVPIVNAAPLQPGKDFLRLLWEGSVVGGTGYVLNYANAPLTGLPAAIFADGGDATLWVVALLTSETASTNPNRTLYPFHNCAVLAGALDPAEVSLSAAPATGTSMLASVPPGNIGFTLTMTNPKSAGSDPAETITQELFQLLGVSLPIELNTTYARMAQGFPLSPGEGSDDTQWVYEQTLSIASLYQLARGEAPQQPGFPLQTLNPYRGIVIHPPVTPPAFAGPEATLVFTFYDVFGNTTTPLASTAVPNLTLPVGYYDPVLPAGKWPSARPSYAFDSADGVAQLELTIAFDASRYLAGGTLSQAAAVTNAASDLAKYAQIYYQVLQPDVQATVASSFDDPAVPPLPNAQVLSGMQGFATAAWMFLDAAQSLLPKMQPVTGDSPTVQTFLLGLGLDAEDLPQQAVELFLANADVLADTFFASTLHVPAVYVTVSGSTLASMVAVDPTVTVVNIVESNEGVTLSEKVDLAIGVPLYAIRSGDTLQGIASILSTTVAILLAANAQTVGLIAANVQVTPPGGGDPVTTTANETFAGLQTALSLATLDALAPIVGQLAGLLVTGASLSLGAVSLPAGYPTGTTYTVRDGDTLRSIAGSTHALAAVAQANAVTANLISPSASITIGGVQMFPGDGATLASIAEFFSDEVNIPTTVASLAKVIADDAILMSGTTIVLTDRIVQAGETFADVMADAGITAEWLALLNAAGPSNFVPPGTVLVLNPRKPYQPIPGDTPSSIAIANGLALEQLASFNLDAGLRTGAALALPEAQVLPPPTVEPPSTVLVPYQTIGAQSFASVVVALAPLTVGDLVALNQNSTMLIALGTQIEYPGVQTFTTEPGTQTLAQIAAACNADSVEDFVTNSAIFDDTSLLMPGALFVIAAPAVGTNVTLATLAAALNVDVEGLAIANASLAGLLVEGTTVDAGGAASPPNLLTVLPTDTLQTLVSRFADGNVLTTVAMIARANADVALLDASAVVLVPPQTVSVTIPIPEPSLPSANFPLTVSLTLARSPLLIHPAYTDAPAVLSATTAVAPETASSSATRSGTTQGSLQKFATRFQDAFASLDLLLATGPDPDASPGPVLWVCEAGWEPIALAPDDSANGAPSTRFYAFHPLSPQLVAVSAQLSNYDPASGTLFPPTAVQLPPADAEVWMRGLLAAIDLVLSPPYAVPAFALSDQLVQQLLDAKQALAAGLATQLAEVETYSPNPDAYADALEAVRQSLLVSLAQGYATDVVLQTFLDIGPMSEGTTAPKLSGVITHQAYVTDALETLQTLQAAFPVALPALATAVEGLPILQTGMIVTLGALQRRIAWNDTLQTLAAGFEVDVVTLAEGMVLPPETALFAAGAPVPLLLVTAQPQAGDTLASIAASLFIGTGALALANAAVANIFNEVSITIGSQTYVVQRGDTLATIAVSFGLTVDAFAAVASVGYDPTLLNPAVTLQALVETPPLSLSTGLLTLEPPIANLTTFLRTTADATESTIPVDLTYTPQQLEFAISPDAIDGYAASSWLNFVLPLPQVTIGQLRVPVPSRFCPATPIFTAQTWDSPDELTIDNCSDWELDFTWQHLDSPQDTTTIEATFASAEAGSIPSPDSTTSAPFYAALAQFDRVWQGLQATLAGLLAPASADTAPLLTAALGTFVSLVQAVVGNWPPPAPSSTRTAPGGSATYTYTAQTTYLEGPVPSRSQLVLSLLSAQPPAPPLLYLPPSTEPLPMFETPGGELVYTYPPDTPAFTPMLHRCVFPGYGVVQYPNGTSLVSVTRNGAFASPFAMATPQVSYTYFTVPFVKSSAVIDIGSGYALGPEVAMALESALFKIIGNTPVSLTLTFEYGLNANPNAELFVPIPAIFLPQQTVSAADGSLANLTTELGTQIASWTQSNVRNVPSDAYQFSITISLDGQTPVLQLTQLTYELSDAPPADGVLIRVGSTASVYLMIFGQACGLPDPDTATNLFGPSWGRRVAIITQEQFDTIPLGPSFRPGTCLVQATGNAAIYLYSWGVLFWIMSEDLMVKYGFDGGSVKQFDPTVINAMPRGVELNE